MITRNLTHRFGSPAAAPMLGLLVLALAGIALAQQTGPRVPPEPPWVTPPTPAPPPAPPPTVAVPQVLPGHIPPQVAVLGLQPLGPMDPTQQLGLAISLPLRDKAGLGELLAQLQDPGSQNYRRFLTAHEFAGRFGPAESDYAAVIAFAKAHNLAVTATWPNRALVDVSGSVADIENAFNVHLLLYQHPYEARQFRAPDVEPSVQLPVPLLHVSGLSDFQVPRPGNFTGSGPGGSFMGYDFRRAYMPDASALTGSGQTVALFEITYTDYFPSDIAAYEAAAGLPNVPLQKVYLDGYDGSLVSGNGNREVSLDIEMAISMAPGLAGVVAYEGLYGDTVLNAIAGNDAVREVSISWYGYGDAGADQAFQQMAAEGKSVFNCSYDLDAFNYGGATNPCVPIFDPMADAWITVVGGTDLTTTSGGLSYVSETVWNFHDGHGSGGGYGYDQALPLSSQTIPSWQTSVAYPGSTYRNFPDVAMASDDIYEIYWHGTVDTGAWGTSAATPLWAGVAALANQQAAANRFPPLGFLNPALYTIGQGPNYSLCFHDITSGNNFDSCSTSQFTAVPGYDLCTGWGTPKGIALVNELIRVADGALGCGQFGGGSFWFAMDFGAAAPSSSVYWASDVTTPPANWTLLSSYAAGSGIWQCSDSGAGSGVTARFYRLQSGGQCWRPTAFIRRQIAAGSWDLFASQFDAPVNTLNGLFNPMPDGTYLPSGAQVSVQYSDGTWRFNTYTWNGGSWSSGGDSVTLSPGQGFWIYNPSASAVTVTFAGLVRQSVSGQPLTTQIPNYEAIYSSMVPQAGLLQTQLGYTPSLGDTVYKWDAGNWDTYTYSKSGSGWSPGEPSIALGQSFVLQPAGANMWTRNFTTCQ